MNTPDLIKNACEDLSARARVPADPAERRQFADRALRRRTRRRSLKVVFSAGSTAILVGAAVAVAVTAGGQQQRRPAPRPSIQPVTLSADTTLRTDLGNTFPRHLVAAGHTAVAAYFTTHKEGSAVGRTWYLYDPGSGTYERTSWSYLDVGPGMHQAAVLEGPLPAARVGVLDMKTRQIVRWISIGHRVGSVSWAPDGRRLLLTAYSASPDVPNPPAVTPNASVRARRASPDKRSASPPAHPVVPGSDVRTGFAVVDAATGSGAFHPLAAYPDNPGSRQDLGWSRSGKLIWAPTATEPTKVFYDVNGAKAATPAHEADYAEYGGDAGLSPNGTLLPKFGPKPGPAVTVRNVTTGKAVAVLPIEQAVAWADDHRLFAIGCAGPKCGPKGEFHNRLLLVSLGGKITPLTGYHRSDKLGAWEPVFTHR